jgi:hypothetical protein
MTNFIFTEGEVEIDIDLLIRELYVLNNNEWRTVPEIATLLRERRETDHNHGFMGQKIVQERISFTDTQEEIMLTTWIEDKQGNRLIYIEEA